MNSLRQLARDRPLVTREIHGPNDYYGHATVLKRYASLRSSTPLKAVIEHAPTPLSEHTWELELQAPLPVLLCAGSERARAIRRASESKVAIPIGPMLSYVPGRDEERVDGRLVAFPAHSTHHVRVSYDAAAFARKLASYRDRFSEIQVCLYWRDVLDGMDAPYRAEGFTCVTAGHMYDAQFLYRLRAILGEAGAVVTNRYGTHVAYAVALDRPVWIIRQTVERVSGDPQRGRFAPPAKNFEESVEDIVAAFSDESEAVTPEQRARLDPFIGFDLMKSPEGIRSILRDAGERYARETPRRLRARHGVARRVVRPLRARWQWWKQTKAS